MVTQRSSCYLTALRRRELLPYAYTFIYSFSRKWYPLVGKQR